MKKSKLLIVGLIALMLTGGLMLAGCDDLVKGSCHGERNCIATGKSTIWGHNYDNCGYSGCAVEKKITSGDYLESDYYSAWCDCQ